MNRRQLLQRIGASIGTPVLSGCSRAEQTGGPRDQREWTLSFEDTFETGALDRGSWSLGWGWGNLTSTSDTRIREGNVSVENNRLQLRGTHENGEIRSGAVNSKGKVTFGPGSYLEARIKFAGREGFQNAFWSKPNSEAWPPELDIVEQWHDSDTEDPARHTHHHLHYSSSGEPGDRSTYTDVGVAYEPGDDVTQNFHVYGVAWRTDRIIHYIDGMKVREWTDVTMLNAMASAAPFYLMASLNINNIGTADTSDQWTEALVVDWVRFWTETD